MHATLMHVPPIISALCSISAVLTPLFPSSVARVFPPLPPPRTMTSYRSEVFPGSFSTALAASVSERTPIKLWFMVRFRWRFLEESFEVERPRKHRQPAVGIMWPLFSRAIPIEFDSVSVWIAQIKRFAHAMIRGSFERDFRFRQAPQGIR